MGRLWTIAITALFCCFLAPLAADDKEQGYKALFNGKDLEGWQLVGGSKKGYVVEDGVLVCPADGGGNLFTAREYGDFSFRFDFKLQKGSNNGVGIRAPLQGDAAYAGMEIQVLDDTAPQYAGKLRPAQYHGSIYDVVPAKQGAQKAVGEWNSEEIVCHGRHVKVILNGKTIVDADLDDVKDEGVLEKHPGLARKSGHIGFLGHGTRVEFRNIRIKEL